MKFTTTSPIDNRLLKSYPQHRWRVVERMVKKAEDAAEANRYAAMNIRSKQLHRLAEILENDKAYFAKLITIEMGKPIQEALAEIEKSVWVCRYFADNAKFFLKDSFVQTEYSMSMVSYAPLGIVLTIMPWNFPFWQVFRVAAAAVMAGNVILLKHAPNVPQCSMAIQSLFDYAQFTEGTLQSLFIDHNKTASLIAHPKLSAVTLTGSDIAGAAIAEKAGKHLKKVVLELGGNDAFIVLNDANLKEAAHAAIQSRMQNAGQSCIAAKRFIVMEDVLPMFTELLTEEIRQLKVGDPMLPDTQIGPLARPDLLEKAERQIKVSLRMGAEMAIGGIRPLWSKGNYLMPTLLTQVRPGMPVFEEEVFAPVASLTSAKNLHEIIALANQSSYGLGASVWTTDTEKALRLSRQLQVGNIFINAIVKSDPRLPFGGTKKSGFGRELGEQGIKELTNIQTIVVQ